MGLRDVEYRPSEAEDIKYMWAAYKKGGLEELNFPEDLNVAEFKEMLAQTILEQGWFMWTLIVNKMPVGVVAGWVSGRQITMSVAMHFPWSSKRNRWESIVAFLDGLRKQAIDQSKDVNDPLRYPVILEFAHFKDKKFWERMADKGIMRRVGHVHYLEEKPSVLFQARSPVKGSN